MGTFAFILILLLGLNLPAFAADEAQLSRSAGKFKLDQDTDLFQIHLDDVDDAYEVETELLEGYDPGYYTVLIEIYSLDHAYMGAS